MKVTPRRNHFLFFLKLNLAKKNCFPSKVWTTFPVVLNWTSFIQKQEKKKTFWNCLTRIFLKILFRERNKNQGRAKIQKKKRIQFLVASITKNTHTQKKNVKINTQRSTVKKRRCFQGYSEFDPDWIFHAWNGRIDLIEPRGYINSNLPYPK